MGQASERDKKCLATTWKQFSSYIMHHQNSPVVLPFGTGSFLIVGKKMGTHPSDLSLSTLTPLDLFFWRFVKDNVYREQVQHENLLRDRIVRTAKCITNEMFANTWQETE
jgi:hypothetical protein